MENREWLQLPLGSKAGGTAYSAAVIINLILSFAASIIIAIFSIGDEGGNYISLLVSPLAVSITLALALRVVKQPAKSLLPIRTHPKFYLIAFMLAFGALFSLSWINDLILQGITLLGYVPRDSFVPDVSGWKVVPVLIVVAVIPAIAEEILFRGIILQNAEEGMGSVRAALVSGFCFSLYHGSIEQTAYQFVLGCLFGLLAVRSRSIASGVLLHFLNNAVIIILMACGALDGTGNLIIPQTVNIILSVLSALSLIGGIVWLILDKTELKKCTSGGVKQFFIFAAVGIAVMALLWIVGLFIK